MAAPRQISKSWQQQWQRLGWTGFSTATSGLLSSTTCKSHWWYQSCFTDVKHRLCSPTWRRGYRHSRASAWGGCYASCTGPMTIRLKNGCHTHRTSGTPTCKQCTLVMSGHLIQREFVEDCSFLGGRWALQWPEQELPYKCKGMDCLCKELLAFVQDRHEWQVNSEATSIHMLPLTGTSQGTKENSSIARGLKTIIPRTITQSNIISRTISPAEVIQKSGKFFKI